MRRFERTLELLAAFLARRHVAAESVSLAALVTSVAAGLALAAGGAAREPRLWLLVPSLGLSRFALNALEARLVDCRATFRRPEERIHGQR
jgi:hypothetical protein